MTQPRKEFLTALFRVLDEKRVPYCVLRNYDAIYEEGPSDVDLGIEPEHLLSMKDCLAEAAAATGHHLVLRARYVNVSYVYWHETGGFIRIDMETEIRWRIFPVLSAKAVVGLRRRQDAFYVPHPRHESVILFVAALWRRSISERYRKQLARLHQQLSSPEELRRTFRAVFGRAGEQLAACQARILEDPPGASLWKGARRSIILNSFRDAPGRSALWGNLVFDLKRLWERLRDPAGVSMLYASSTQPPRNLEELFGRIKSLFPMEKTAKLEFHVSPDSLIRRPGLRMRLQRLYVLFKGGLFLRFYELPRDQDIPGPLRTHPRYLYPSRTFVLVENSRFEVYLGHVKTGFMAHLTGSGSAPVSDREIIRFLSVVLERQRLLDLADDRKRGAFVVLVGLDGSGKTTVARTLCCLGPAQETFSRIRYFHWLPRLFKGLYFPLPDFQNTPRKPKRERSLVQSALSTTRLCKNLLWANLAYLFCIRRLVRQGSLVVMDRYYYNYYLDPVSVKYYGPRWLLDLSRRLFPKPDLVVVLKTPTDTLLARKQELSPEEIVRQKNLLEQLPFAARHTLEVDAARPPDVTAREILRKAAEVAAQP